MDDRVYGKESRKNSWQGSTWQKGGSGAKSGNVARSRTGKNYAESKAAGEASTGGVRLSICVILLIGMLGLKLAFPQAINRSGERILEILSTDADFKSAMTCLGETISGREDISTGVVQAAEFILGTYEDGIYEDSADKDSAENDSTNESGTDKDSARKDDADKDGAGAKKDDLKGKYSVMQSEEKNAEYM